MMLNSKKWKILTILFGVIALGSLAGLHLGDVSLLTREQVVFNSPENDPLFGILYPGTGRTASFGFLMLEGFGSDQVTMRSAVREFAKMGSVFTFDFSGHGRSPGGLDFNNAETNRLALQALAAKEEFKRLSGIPDEHIFVVGHSLGARVALQAASMDPNPPAGLILMGTQVNLSTNVQSEFFTGVQDRSLPWVQALGPETPETNILLISGEWDDILTPQAAQALFAQLSGADPDENWMSGSLENGNRRQLVILDGLIHNYEVFSPRVLSLGLKWAADTFSLIDTPADVTMAEIRIWLWGLGFGSLLAGLITANRWAAAVLPQQPAGFRRVQITSLRRFLIGKLLLWLVAVPLMGIVGGLVFLIPLHKPVFNLYFVAFIGGYGLLLWLLYRLGRMPGTQGRLPFCEPSTLVSTSRYFGTVGLGIVLLMFTAAFARSGWFYVFPLNQRLLWLVLFVPVTALGFWIGSHESSLVDEAAKGRFLPRLAVSLTGLLPFFLYAGFLAGIGSLSGVVGGLQGLLILWLVLLAGSLMENICKKPWLVALFQAILLYWMVLPQGVLFR